MPGDLNLKKSWNPALLKNQKKVWEREQEALKEYQAIKQKSKEIASEREKEEMIRLQYGNNPALLPSKHKLELNKLGWMYDGPSDRPKEDESGFREVEEDFMANTKEVESLMHGSRAVSSTPSRFDHVASAGASRAAPSVLSDDPLLKIRKQRVSGREGHRQSSKGGEGSDWRGARSESERHHRGSKDRSRREGDRSRREGDRSSREGDRSRRDGDRSRRDGDRSRRDGDRSSREGDRGSRERNRDRSSRDRSFEEGHSVHKGSREEIGGPDRVHGGRSHRDRSPESNPQKKRHSRETPY